MVQLESDGHFRKRKEEEALNQAGEGWEADIHTSVCVAEAGGVIYAQPVGGRE